MSEPRSYSQWWNVPASIQEETRVVYQALVDAALEDGDGGRVYAWEHLPTTQKLALANAVQGTRYRIGRLLTRTLQDINQKLV